MTPVNVLVYNDIHNAPPEDINDGIAATTSIQCL